uniref:Inner mitochondrial membrane peptidase subunit 2 n=1 Tax=Oreochromis niloticus TaxID=8128 RepID=A0A669CRU3_ORENI
MAQQATAGRRCLRAFVSGFFVAVPVTVTFLDRFAYVARVEGSSMQPFLNPEGGSKCDVVLLNRWSVRNYQVQRGDIVSVVQTRAAWECLSRPSSVPDVLRSIDVPVSVTHTDSTCSNRRSCSPSSCSETHKTEISHSEIDRFDSLFQLFDGMTMILSFFP